jgi:uncharacterized protein YdcH (DUF465 family)
LLKKLKDEISIINEELYKKAEGEHIDRLFALHDNHEERIKSVESMKVL